MVVSGQDFAQQANITRTIEVKAGQMVNVSLDSNPSTGFSWSGDAAIADTSVLTQKAHGYVAPTAGGGQSNLVGAPGTETWAFEAAKAGQTTVTMQYSRPWEGGEKAARTFVLTVVVK